MPQPDSSSISTFTHLDRKSTRLNSSHSQISYAVFCLKKKKNHVDTGSLRRQSSATSCRSEGRFIVFPFMELPPTLTHPTLLRIPHSRGRTKHKSVQT